jgi:hypothetical protein
VKTYQWPLTLSFALSVAAARRVGAGLGNKTYAPIISGKYRWSDWAAPKTKGGEIHHNAALAGDDLKNFVINELFPFSQPSTRSWSTGLVDSVAGILCEKTISCWEAVLWNGAPRGIVALRGSNSARLSVYFLCSRLLSKNRWGAV